MYIFLFYSDVSGRGNSGTGSCDDSTILHQQSSVYHHSHSNPDLMTIVFDDSRNSEYPEHVLKVYKPDQTCKYLLVHKVSIHQSFFKL